MSHGERRHRLEVDGIGRVEGEGAVVVELEGDEVRGVLLDIFEPPRFFESLLRGRRPEEVPDIVARICGICPVAYQTSACAALEQAAGVEAGERIWALRRLLYCGEWIQSHALHIHLLHAPDYLGVPDAVALARQQRRAVERGLSIKKTGNLLMATVGGRPIHPVNVRLGGFYSAPSPAAVKALAEPLRRALDDSLATLEWVAGFERPQLERDYRFGALTADRYPIERGRVSTSFGLETDAAGLEPLIVEEHEPHSTALHARIGGLPYLTGPLARYALNASRLTPLAAQGADRAGLGRVCRNPFDSIVVRAVECVLACEEALELVAAYEPPDPPAVAVSPSGASGWGTSEAPRGLLLHRYDVDRSGAVAAARIVPPTSQNQATIEADLREVAIRQLEGRPATAGVIEADLTARLEQAVRNHDPCISCAAHFLEVEVRRR